MRASRQPISQPFPAIASLRLTIAGGVRPLLRYIPETKSAIPDGAPAHRGERPRAASGGTTHGTRFAVWDAPASGRRDATKMWGDQLVNKPVGETAMKTNSSSLIRAIHAQQWGSRKNRGIARDAVPASRVSARRFDGIRVLRFLERLPFAAALERIRCRAPFRSLRSAGPFIPNGPIPFRVRPCRAIPSAPPACRRRPD